MEGLTPTQRVRRGFRSVLLAQKFLRETKSQIGQKSNVFDMMLSSTKAVAKHWQSIWVYYSVFAVATVAWLFFIMDFFASLSGQK